MNAGAANPADHQVTRLQVPDRDPVLAQHAADFSRLMRIGVWVVALGAIPAIGWVAGAPLTSAVVANAVVKVDLNRVPVQHAEGGTVAEVRVRDGQRVRQGETLMVLGDVSVSADMDRLSFRVLAERAAVARLEAEQTRAATMVFPVDLLRVAAQDDRLAQQVTKERQLFVARRDALEGQVALLRAQRDRIFQEMGQLRQQVEAVERSLQLQSDDLDTQRNLLKEGFVSSARIGQVEAQVADYMVKLAEKRSDLTRAHQRLGDIELRMLSMEGDYRQQASDQLKVTMQRLTEIEQEHRKASDAKRRQVIVAPADGEVMGLRATSPGTVIPPREPVAEIVPDNPRLVIEAQIRPEDIEHVHVGSAADVRIAAFDPRTIPPLRGKVTYVSGDRVVDRAANSAYYLVHVEAETEALRQVSNLQLQAGMPAEVYARGRSRTVLDYLLEPVSRVIWRGARER